MRRNILTLFLVISVQAYQGFCNEGQMYSRHEGDTSWSGHYCIFYNPHFYSLPTHRNLADIYQLIDLSERSGCNISDFDTVHVSGQDVAVVVARGNCTFVQKADNAQAAGAKAVIIASEELLVPGATNASVDYNQINITVATALWSSIRDIQKKEPKAELLLYSPDTDASFDPNIVLIFVIAVSNVCIGGYWAGRNKHQKYLKLLEKRKKKEMESPESGSGDKEKAKEEEDESVDITLPAVVVFFILVCGFIILLYFFYDKLVYVVIALFCLAGAMGMYSCLHPVWKKLVPFRAQVPPNKVPFLRSRPEYRNLMFGLLCLGVGVWWGVERHAPYSWVLQDILGYMFCINVMKSISIPNLKISTIMLLLLFVYDIFFVFVTPHLTSSGDSVMVKVATGGNTKTRETIPMAFRVPKLTPGVCPVSDSLLGFGEIVIPGLLVCHNHAFDLKNGIRRLYFISTTCTYSVGLIVTFLALYLMQTGQPALLYIVPCTLLTTFVIGFSRGELKKLWTGSDESLSAAKNNKNTSDNQSSRSADGNLSISSTESSSDNENKRLIQK